MLRGSFGHLLLGRSSLPFASFQTPKMLRGSCDQALWPAAPSHSGLQTPKMLRGSFDQARWPQAFVVNYCVQACRLPP